METECLRYLQEAGFEHVPTFYGNFECGQKGYIVTKKLDGNLASLLRTPVTASVSLFNTILLFLRRVVSGLQSMGIKHNDIHFRNIVYEMINDGSDDTRFKFYIIDFNEYQISSIDEVKSTPLEKLIMDQCVFSDSAILTELCHVFADAAVLDLTYFPGNEIFKRAMELMPFDLIELKKQKELRVHPDSCQQAIDERWEKSRKNLKRMFRLKEAKAYKSAIIREVSIGEGVFYFRVRINNRTIENLQVEQMLYLGFEVDELLKRMAPIEVEHKKIKDWILRHPVA